MSFAQAAPACLLQVLSRRLDSVRGVHHILISPTLEHRSTLERNVSRHGIVVTHSRATSLHHPECLASSMYLDAGSSISPQGSFLRRSTVLFLLDHAPLQVTTRKAGRPSSSTPATRRPMARSWSRRPPRRAAATELPPSATAASSCTLPAPPPSRCTRRPIGPRLGRHWRSGPGRRPAPNCRSSSCTAMVRRQLC